jgi:hypothetical protein
MFGLRKWNVVNFEDILYTPLDVPDLPDFNVGELIGWLKETYPKYKSVNEYIASRGHSSEKKIENYPWDLTPIYLNMHGEKYGWVNGFEQKFPQLCQHISTAYGLTLDEIGSVYSLPMKEDYVGWGFWHKDYDPSGIRFYFEYESNQDNGLYIKKEGEEGNGVQCRVKSPRQSFFLNNINAVHATYTPKESVGKTRVAAFITPRFDNVEEFMDKTRKLIIDSASNYMDTYARFA